MSLRTMNVRMCGFCTLLISLLPGPVAVAQTGRAGDGAKAAEAPANLSFGTTPGSSDTTRSSSAQFVLDATSKDRVGTFAVGWKEGHGNALLAFSAPLDSNDSAAPASLTGLAKGATARLAFSRLNWKSPTPLEQDAAEKLCLQLKLPLNECHSRSEKMPLKERAILEQLEHVYARPWLIGGEFSVTRRNFQFLDKDSLVAGTANKNGVSATARIGAYSPTFGFLFGSYSYKQDFEAGGRPTDICQPIEGTKATRCQSAILGAPTDSDLSLATVELRRLFVSGGAVAPQVSYDFKSDHWLAEVPVYFVPGAGKVMGGVRFNWRSDTKAVTAIVFIGTALEVY